VKKLLLLISMAALLLIPSVAAYAQLDALPAELKDRIEDLLATRFPPQLKSVTIEPEAPAADEAITVTAEISNDSEVTEDETTEAYIFFSIDGGESWEEVEMESDDDKTWTGEIPGQESGTDVIWGIRAVDSSGNFYTDVPCQMAEAPGGADYIAKDCLAEDIAQCEEDMLPMTCMVAAANDETPIDDDDSFAPPDFDYQNFHIGYDKDKIYLDLTVQGKVSDGKVAPMSINIYAAVLINVDKAGNSTDLNELLNAGAALVHAPLAKIAGGLVKPCFYGYSQGGTFAQDEKSIACNPEGSHLFFTIDRKAIKDNKSGLFQFLAADGRVTSISPVTFAVYDMTRVSQVNLNPRSFTVE
jgi:hypothetical protein